MRGMHPAGRWVVGARGAGGVAVAWGPGVPGGARAAGALARAACGLLGLAGAPGAPGACSSARLALAGGASAGVAARGGAVLVVLAPESAAGAPWELEERAAWLLGEVARACGAQLDGELGELEQRLERGGGDYTAASALESPGAAVATADRLLSKTLLARLEGALERAEAGPRRLRAVLEPGHWPSAVVAGFLFHRSGEDLELIGRRPGADGLFVGSADGASWAAVRTAALAAMRASGPNLLDEQPAGSAAAPLECTPVEQMPTPAPENTSSDAPLEAIVIPLHHMPGTCAILYHRPSDPPILLKPNY